MNAENIREYLLGTLPEAALDKFDEWLMMDDAALDEVQMAEDELVDEYLAGQLDGPERERFENWFLKQPGRAEKLRFARTFRSYLSKIEPAGEPETETSTGIARTPSVFSFLRFPKLKWALASAILLVVALGSFLIYRQVVNRRAPAGGGNLFAVSLTHGASRGAGGTQTFSIPAGATGVELKLMLVDEDYAAYRAQLKSADGRAVSSVNNLKTREENSLRFVSLPLPSEALSGDDYVVELTGVTQGGAAEEIGNYYFRVIDASGAGAR